MGTHRNYGVISFFPYICYAGIFYYIWDKCKLIPGKLPLGKNRCRYASLNLPTQSHILRKQRQVRWSSWCRVTGHPITILLTQQGWQLVSWGLKDSWGSRPQVLLFYRLHYMTHMGLQPSRVTQTRFTSLNEAFKNFCSQNRMQGFSIFSFISTT